MKVLLARIGWGDSYDSENNLVGGGYVSGSDRFNFQIASDGRVYGFFPVGSGHNNLNLLRVDKTAGASDRVEHVLIVWVSTRPKTGGQYVVGWHSDATLMKDVLERPDHGHYRTVAAPEMCSLVPLADRDFQIRPGIISGQSSVRYFPSDDPAIEEEFQRVAQYVKLWKIRSSDENIKATKPIAEIEAEAQLEREQGFQSDVKLRVLIEKYAEKLVREDFALRNITLEQHPKPQWPWDFRYSTGASMVYIEIKGTQGNGQKFIITRGEKQFAQIDPNRMELWIVCNIKVERSETPSLSGGTLVKVHPWNPSEHDLSAINYMCQIKLPA